MESRQRLRKISQVYLTLVPILTAVFGFGIGYISYKIYLPIWITNVCLMIIASWILGAHLLQGNDTDKKQQVAAALFFIGPWMLTSMFFGLGPPPVTVEGWVATATEQQVRYSFLIAAGIMVASGFLVLREKLKNTAGSFYSLLGVIAILIAIPLFIINMTFWGSFLVEFFKIINGSGSEKRPDWFQPVRAQFEIISVVEVALTYLATAAFAASLYVAGWFRKTPTRIYILFGLLGFILIMLHTSPVEWISGAGFFVSIPAIPFMMPYLMGINLLRRAGN